MTEFESGGLRDIDAELGAKFCHVVGKERGLEACARDGDVAEAGVEQVRVDAGIGVNQDALSGEGLGAVTGDGVAVVEMTMLVGVEFDLAVVVELCRKPIFSSSSARIPQSINYGTASVDELRELKPSVSSTGGSGRNGGFWYKAGSSVRTPCRGIIAAWYTARGNRLDSEL